MENKTFIGVYHNESELLSKINELKTQGYRENDIYVTAKNEDDLSMVRGRAEVQSAGGSLMDRFMAFLSGDEPVRGAFRNMGLSDEEADRYYQEVQNGGFLLYVDREYGSLYSSYDVNQTDAPADPIASAGLTDLNLGGNLHSPEDEQLKPLDEERLDAFAAERAGTERAEQEEETLRLHEERININTERVQTGEVRVEKELVEEEQVIDVPVEREEVFVERRPVVDSEVTKNEEDLTAFDGRNRTLQDENETIRVPVTEEQVEVTKKPVVTEEIVIGKRKVQDTETVQETVRREEAHVEETSTARKDRDLL